jgi:hypothetical protein
MPLGLVPEQAMTTPLRFHVLIGPPSSGRTTLMRHLVGRLKAGGRNAIGLPITEQHLTELEAMFPWSLLAGKAAAQAPLAALPMGGGGPVELVIDGVATTRAQRLRIMQILDPGRPVEWIGWWLHTPLETCHSWSSRGKMASRTYEKVDHAFRQLTDRWALPSIEEGFSALVHLDPSEFRVDGDAPVLDGVLDLLLEDLDGCCAAVAAQREGLVLHAYSCLVEFAELMRHLALELCPDRPTRSEIVMRTIQGIGMNRHGNYVPNQLWLLENDMLMETTNRRPIVAPPPTPAIQRHRGGWHRYADAQAFLSLMEELRQYLHTQPDDASVQPSPALADVIVRYGLQERTSDVLPMGLNLQ